MRKRIVFQCLLLAVVLSTACSDENAPLSVRHGQEGTLTFMFPGIKKGMVSYADPIATTGENQLSDLTIYMFNDNSNKLEKVFNTDDISVDGSGVTPTATIDVTDKSGKKTFYFVGNGKDRSEALRKLDPGITLVSEFLEILTDLQPDPLKTPLLMSGVSTIVDIEQPLPDELKVNLARRVSRFDVVNNPDETNFEIKKVLISGACLRASIFPDASEETLEKIERGTYEAIEFQPVDPQNPVATDSIFYLYPTQIGENLTHIALEGLFNGKDTKVYNINLPDTVDIKANYRYILKAKVVSINEVEFNITIEKWVDASEEEAQPETELVDFSTLTIEDCDGINLLTTNTYDITAVTTTGKITFTTTSYSQKGTGMDIKYTFGNASSLSELEAKSLDPDPVATYGVSFVQRYEILIPAQSANKVPVELNVTIYNKANPDQKRTITLCSWRYPGTTLYPIKFGDTYWAPVNVGAGTLNGTTEVGDIGLLYQWGRSNIGFSYNSGLPPVDDLAQGPVSLSDATTGNVANKFIIAPNPPYDWLNTPQNDLWVGNNAKGPCPDGWRLPNDNEWEKIVTAYGSAYNDNVKIVNKRLEVKGTNDGEILYFPLAGARRYDNGESNSLNSTSFYWSSGINGSSSKALKIDESSVGINQCGRANACSVRCIQQ